VDLLEPADEIAVRPLPRAQRVATLVVAAPFVNGDGDRFAELVANADALACAVPMRRLRSRRDDSFATVADHLAEAA
jgi:hypothetical protein